VARERRGWTQAALAEAAGVPRPTVSAAETGRVVPSVQTALALARALGTDVETLFGEDAPGAAPDRWASPVQRTPVRYWQARVGGRRVAYPVEVLWNGSLAQDGVLGPRGDWAVDPAARPEDTLVIATGDPAAGLLAEALARRGVRPILLARPSRESLRLLKEGLVHAAGLHFSHPLSPDENRVSAQRALGGAPQVLLRYAEWEVGIALSPGAAGRKMDALLDGTTRWVNRPQGSGARACLDRLLLERGSGGRPRPPPPGYERECRDPRAALFAIQAGFAEAAISTRWAAEDAGLAFEPLDREAYELCVPKASLRDPRIQTLFELVAQPVLRARLAALPGLSTAGAGATIDA
jgi:putative molybdopterin biosynthesis protein